MTASPIKVILLVLSAVLSIRFIGAQNVNVPPKSKSANVAVILKRIQEKVNAQGEIRYAMVSENLVRGGTAEDQYVIETSGAVVHPSSCSIELNGRMAMNGKTQSQGRMMVPVRELTKIVVRTQTQLINERTARSGVTGWKGTIKPESYAVQAFQGASLDGMFFFRDEESANLVAKSLGQAVQLCGGQLKE